MKGITKRQMQLLDFIQSFIQKHRYSPSYREIKEHFGFASLGSVYNSIKTLKRKGLLTNEAHCSRSLTLNTPIPIQENSAYIDIAMVGYVDAENGIEMLAELQTLSVPSALVKDPKKTYLLRVRDDSFISELIADSDLVLIQAKTEPAPGSTILATSLQKRRTMIRRYYPEGLSLRLQSARLSEPPEIACSEEIAIHGMVVAALRLYD